MTTSIAPSRPAQRPRIREAKHRRGLTWLWVILVTLAAAVLRFWSLDQPAIWGDEAAVYWRTCGTYRQLLDILKNDGFAPLHYELYWVLQQLFTMTPWAMRFIPALSAVLMVPAMYWLASQLVGKRAALTVAAFTAVSSHLGWHSHDAKMYAHFWLLCTLNMACFIWWLRKADSLRWWCWVASGVAIVGLLSTGFIIIALQPLMLIFGPRRNWRMFAAYALGLAIISIGPAFYYLYFNQWTRNIENQGWAASGIAWVEQINARQTPGQLVRGFVTQLFFGYDFPPPLIRESGISKWWVIIQDFPIWLAIALLVAIFPWPTRNRGRGVSDMAQPWWRTSLYLGAWALLPAYAFYCASFAGYPWPHQILASLFELVVSSAGTAICFMVVIAAAAYFLAPDMRGRLRLTLQGAALIGAFLLIGTAIAWASSVRPPGQIWVTRYMTLIWPAAMVVTFALLVRLPLWPIRWLIISSLIAMNLVQGISRISSPQEPPVDLLVSDILAAKGSSGGLQACFLGQSMLQVMQPLERRYYIFMRSGEKCTPEEFRGSNIRRRFSLTTAATPQSISKMMVTPAQRVVVWEQVPGPTEPNTPRMYPDKLAKFLPAGWNRTSEAVYPFTSRWGWGPITAWRRSEYAPIATTQPAQ